MQPRGGTKDYLAHVQLVGRAGLELGITRFHQSNDLTTQPRYLCQLISLQVLETIGEKRCDHLFLRWKDLVVRSIRKVPHDYQLIRYEL